ncbi:MAG: NAD(P)/FAD-dependent oxidoreductase [Lentisphaeria bacterium]|nr:NAD(P)/FAD-dependent oxidoreductase [Lentisphaeria bacterium]
MKISLDNLILSAKTLPEDIDRNLQPYIAAKCGIKAGDVLSYRIVKRSVDARRKGDIKLLYTLVADLPDNVKSAFPLVPAPESPESTENIFVNKSHIQSPVIIGAGPAGLFAAYVLALAGCKPVILERGRSVDARKFDIEGFLATRQLNPESNFLYGEGGAGTWSDGKLYTRVRDPRVKFVLDTFVECGASPAISYFSHPHIGSDKLPQVISALRKKIIALGGTFRWNAKAVSLLVREGRCKGVLLASGEKVEAPAVISACGHSARELILSMISSGVDFTMKGFQIGCRIEHPQNYINRIMYGLPEAPPAVGSAEYNFVSRPMSNGSIGGATTFCMCPGGEIIPSTAEEGRLSTNGMSNAARNGRFANSAIISTMDEKMFSSPQKAFAFLDELEKKVFASGGGDYTCPAQSAVDFVRRTSSGSKLFSSYSMGLRPARLDEILPGNIAKALHRALKHFDSMATSFINRGVLVGLETHVSSPVRFTRDPETLGSSLPGLYTAGEGAGMAGGITSSAADGIRIAEALLSNPV